MRMGKESVRDIQMTTPADYLHLSERVLWRGEKRLTYAQSSHPVRAEAEWYPRRSS